MKQMPISKQNDRLNGDMTLRQYERGNAGVRLPGRNDIRQDRCPRPGYGVCQLAPYGRTVALRGLLYRPVLRLAERRKRESERSASKVLSQRQEAFPCCPLHIKTRPGVAERQAS